VCGGGGSGSRRARTGSSHGPPGQPTSAAVLFAVLALLWRSAARDDTADFRRSSLMFVAGTVACAAVLAGTIMLSPDAPIVAWLLLDTAYLAGLAAMIGLASPVPAAALTVTDALIERFGLFTIIVLGEVVTGVVDDLSCPREIGARPRESP
jgi:low temperature requirement protein LtrA